MNQNHDDKKNKSIYDAINGVRNSNGTNTETEAPTNTEEKVGVGTIEIEEPQEFTPVECTMYKKASEVAALITEVLSAVFVDFRDCRVYYNSQVAGVGVTARFKFLTKDEMNMVNGDERVVAVTTPAGAVQETENPVVTSIKRYNAATGKGNNNKYAVLTEKGKAYLKDLVVATGQNGKIEWDKVVQSVCTDQTAINGQQCKIVYLDVNLDINKLLRMIFNGTQKCKDYKRNSRFYYIPYYFKPISGMDFYMKINRVDSRLMAKLNSEAGVYTTSPTIWNV